MIACYVHDSGYRISQATQDPADALVVEAEPFFCLSHSIQLPGKLFRTFANLNRTEIAVIRFANRYGFLGVEGPDEVLRQAWAEVVEGDIRARGVELLSGWFREIDFMALAVELWGGIKKPNTPKLKGLIEWRDAVRFGLPAKLAACHFRGREIEAGWHIPELAEDDRYNPPSVVWPARVALGQLVDHGLRRPLNARQRGAPSVGVGLCLNKETGMFEFHQEPETLLAAMWLQFAQTITGRSDEPHKPTMHVCAVCGKEYLARKSFGRYCGNPCRQKHYRATRTASGIKREPEQRAAQDVPPAVR